MTDFAVLFVCVEYVFGRNSGPFLYLSACIAFTAGFAVNYILSVFFVFPESARSVRSFFAIIAVALSGLGLTELGLYIGVSLLTGNYMIVKVAVSGLALLWNYGGRKFFLGTRRRPAREEHLWQK